MELDLEEDRSSATTGGSDQSSPTQNNLGGRRSIVTHIMGKMRRLQQQNEELQAKLKDKSPPTATPAHPPDQHAAALQEEVKKWETLYFEAAELGAKSIERLEAQIERLEKEKKRLQEERKIASEHPKGKSKTGNRVSMIGSVE